MYLHHDRNQYPNILLSDSIIKQITIKDNGDIKIEFDKNGFFLRKNGKYNRTNSAMLIMRNSNIDNISLNFVLVKNFGRILSFKFLKEVKFEKLINNINNKNWQCTILSEYYSDTGTLLILHVKKNEKKFKCSCNIEFKYLEYFWD